MRILSCFRRPDRIHVLTYKQVKFIIYGNIKINVDFDL